MPDDIVEALRDRIESAIQCHTLDDGDLIEYIMTQMTPEDRDWYSSGRPEGYDYDAAFERYTYIEWQIVKKALELLIKGLP